jgi:peptidoglycan hydrolase CwlO-like protein
MSDTGQVGMNNPQSMMNKRRNTRPRWKDFLSIFLFLVVWGGLVWGGFYIAKQYLDKSINNIQQTNAMNMQEVNEKLDSLNLELQALKKEISNTDQTISSSGSIQVELNKKIMVLDQQLKNLEKSLKILKEAPNARR